MILRKLKKYKKENAELFDPNKQCLRVYRQIT